LTKAVMVGLICIKIRLYRWRFRIWLYL